MLLCYIYIKQKEEEKSHDGKHKMNLSLMDLTLFIVCPDPYSSLSIVVINL